MWRKVTLLARANARLPIVSRVAVFTSSAPLLTRSCNGLHNPRWLIYATHYSGQQQGLRSCTRFCYGFALEVHIELSGLHRFRPSLMQSKFIVCEIDKRHLP